MRPRQSLTKSVSLKTNVDCKHINNSLLLWRTPLGPPRGVIFNEWYMNNFIQLSVEGGGGYTASPGNTGWEVGIYPGCDARPWQGTTHILTGEELVNPEDMQPWTQDRVWSCEAAKLPAVTLSRTININWKQKSVLYAFICNDFWGLNKKS